MQVITQEVAAKEVEGWLNFKRIPEAYIKGSGAYVNGITISVMEGIFTIDPATKEITHKLLFPIGVGEFQITELKYKPRLGVSVIQASIAGLSPVDLTGRTLGTIAAMCGRPRTEIGPMDSEDFRAASDLAAFFSQ